MLLGTIALSMAASISANLLCDLNAGRTISSALAFVSVVLMAAGVVFYWLYAWEEHLIHQFTEECEKRERDFGLACVDEDYNHGVFVNNYHDPDYHLGREEVLYARVQFQKTQTITRPMLGKLKGDARECVFGGWDQRRRIGECLGFLLLSVAAIVLIFPLFLSMTHHPLQEEERLPSHEPAASAPNKEQQLERVTRQGKAGNIEGEAGVAKGDSPRGSKRGVSAGARLD